MFTIRTHSLACLLTIGWALVWVPQAQAVDGLGLSEALARALRDNPELRIYPYERRAAEADKLQAGLRPNPELGALLENFAGTGAVRGIKSSQTTLTLSQLIELGGKRERRVEVAEHALGGVAVDYDVTFADRLQTSPDFAHFASERRLREAEVRLAQAESVPDLTLGVGVRRLNSGAEVGGTGTDYGLVTSLNLPLPLFNRNQGKIAAAEARVDQSEAERDAALLRTRAVLYGLYQAAAQARRQSEALRGEAMTQAEQALTLTQRGFGNGRFSFLELADAQRQELELRGQAITAAADAQRIDTEIERLTGQPVVAAAAPAGAIR